MTSEGLKLLQQQQLMIMDDIHRVCVQNGLIYYLIGGSAIGAVRHNGIIPWDADIDIAIPRKDYEKFIKIAPNKLQSCHSLYHNGNVKHYRNGHATVCLNNSNLIISGDYINPQIRRFGIYVDILPLDFVPSNNIVRMLQKNLLSLFKQIRSIFLIKNKITDRGIKKIIKAYALIPLFKYAPLSTINKFQHIVCKWGNKNPNSTEICSMLSHYSYDRLCMKKEWFAQPVLHEFSGRSYYVATDVHMYLSKLFGNYMKLPSAEQQNEMRQLIEETSWIENNSKITIT